MSDVFPALYTGQEPIDRAFRIALGDLVGNIVPHHGGLLEAPRPVVLAGLCYDRPWTRDAAINTWNGAGLLFPEVTRDTMISVLERTEDGVRIGGQYWDAIIWTVGAWWQYLYSGDRAFLALALEATRNSLAPMEATEFDPETGLFRGPAVYGDGVAGYPLPYAQAGGNSSILQWPRYNPDQASVPGYGLPMKTLSTNCAYYQAYILAQAMAIELDQEADPAWAGKAAALREAIERHFWREDAGCYRYLVGPLGDSDCQEGMGHSLALLFDVASPVQAAAVLENQFVAPAGIPCVWPPFQRYVREEGAHLGRHSGTVWPHIQGLWAHAAAQWGHVERFKHEMQRLAAHAVRDNQFAELYHPFSEQIYGGLQEAAGEGIREWASCPRQTWSATAFLRAIVMGLCGMVFGPAGVGLSPLLPPGFTKVHLTNVRYREMILDLTITGPGAAVKRCAINGQEVGDPFLSADGAGKRRIEIAMTGAA